MMMGSSRYSSKSTSRMQNTTCATHVRTLIRSEFAIVKKAPVHSTMTQSGSWVLLSFLPVSIELLKSEKAQLKQQTLGVTTTLHYYYLYEYFSSLRCGQ